MLDAQQGGGTEAQERQAGPGQGMQEDQGCPAVVCQPSPGHVPEAGLLPPIRHSGVMVAARNPGGGLLTTCDCSSKGYCTPADAVPTVLLRARLDKDVIHVASM